MCVACARPWVHRQHKTKKNQNQNCQRTKHRMHCSWDPSLAKPPCRACPGTALSNSCPWAGSFWSTGPKKRSKPNSTHVECFPRAENNLDPRAKFHQSLIAAKLLETVAQLSNSVLYVPSLALSDQPNYFILADPMDVSGLLLRSSPEGLPLWMPPPCKASEQWPPHSANLSFLLVVIPSGCNLVGLLLHSASSQAPIHAYTHTLCLSPSFLTPRLNFISSLDCSLEFPTYFQVSAYYLFGIFCRDLKFNTSKQNLDSPSWPSSLDKTKTRQTVLSAFSLLLRSHPRPKFRSHSKCFRSPYSLNLIYHQVPTVKVLRNAFKYTQELYWNIIHIAFQFTNVKYVIQ